MNQGVGGLSAEASKLFRVNKTCWKMLEKRNYIVIEELRDMTAEEFKDRFGEMPSRDSLTIMVAKVDNSEDQMFVFFPNEEKVGVQQLNMYWDRMKAANVRRCIVVVRDRLTPMAKNFVKELQASHGFRIEYFKDLELLVDITEHKLVPQHDVLSPQQKQELLDRYRLKPYQLPRILVRDPIARYYGLKQGQVVKIVRHSETAGRYITYRICI